jgi:hypothetical protein
VVNTVDFESTTLGSTPSGSLSSLSSVGRAVDCSSKGQVFDSPREDFFFHSSVGRACDC